MGFPNFSISLPPFVTYCQRQLNQRVDEKHTQSRLREKRHNQGKPKEISSIENKGNFFYEEHRF